MTPVEVEVALHHYYNTHEFPKDGQSYRDAEKMLIAKGLLKTSHENQSGLEPTEGLCVYVRELCKIPLPVQRMVWTIEGYA